MKAWLAILVIILLVLQYKLWLREGSLSEVYRLQRAVQAQQQKNVESRERNQALEGEVKDLKQGLEAIEERARSELGMVRKGETFYQIVEE